MFDIITFGTACFGDHFSGTIKNKVAFCYRQEAATLFRDKYASSYVLPKRLFQ